MPSSSFGDHPIVFRQQPSMWKGRWFKTAERFLWLKIDGHPQVLDTHASSARDQVICRVRSNGIPDDVDGVGPNRGLQLGFPRETGKESASDLKKNRKM